MTYDKIYEQFKDDFSVYADQIAHWSVYNENSIKVSLKNGQEYVYTVTNSGFRFEKVKGD